MQQGRLVETTGDDDLDERINLIVGVFDLVAVPYDELSYRALAQIAAEVQILQGLPVYVPVLPTGGRVQ